MKETFGQKMQRWRESAHISQAELSRRTGYSRAYISNLERDFSPTAQGGKPQPSVETCDKIARALGVPIAEARLAAGYAAPEEVKAEKKKTITAEEALKNAFFFHAKGLSQKDIETIRPFLEGVDKVIERLKEDEE